MCRYDNYDSHLWDLHLKVCEVCAFGFFSFSVCVNVEKLKNTVLSLTASATAIVRAVHFYFEHFPEVHCAISAGTGKRSL